MKVSSCLSFKMCTIHASICDALSSGMCHFAHSKDSVARRTATLSNTLIYRRIWAAIVVGTGRVETMYETAVGVGRSVRNVCAGGAVRSCRYSRIVTVVSWFEGVTCDALTSSTIKVLGGLTSFSAAQQQHHNHHATSHTSTK